MNKQKLLTWAAISIGTAGIIGLGVQQYTYAEETNNYSPIVQKLIEKFKLNTDEVDKVISEVQTEREKQREEMATKRKTEMEEKLTQAVKDGKITEEQKTKIMALMENSGPNQNKNKGKDFANLSTEERKAKMEEMRKEREQHRTDMEALEKEIGMKICDLLGFEEGMGFGGQRRGGDWDEE